jgi:hypothetical protein
VEVPQEVTAALPIATDLPTTSPPAAPLGDDAATRPVTIQVTAALPVAAHVPPDRAASAARLRILSMVGIIVALLAIVVVAVLAATDTLTFGPTSSSATPTPSTVFTPPPTFPTGFTPYAFLGYCSIDYPSSWHLVPIPAHTTSTPGTQADIGVEFLDPDGTSFLEILVNQTPTPPSPQSVDDTVLRVLANGTPVKNLQGSESATVGGATWIQETADLTVRHFPGRSHVVVMTTIQGLLTYTILYLAPASSFDTVNSAVFQTILNTFSFTP